MSTVLEPRADSVEQPASTAPWWRARRLTAADLRHDANGFTPLRWLLASAVMFSHAWDLTQFTTGLDPSVDLLSLPVSRLAVFLFFTLSGFLVTGSLIKRGVRDYAIARALRMIPGLWAMLAVVVIGLWLLFSDMPLLAYLSDPLTLRYLATNALLIDGAYHLPGMFENLPITGVNGSLWTLPQEVRCYIALALLAAIGLLARRSWLTALFVAGTALHLALPIGLVPALAQPRALGFSFFLGVLAYLWRERLLLSWPLALVAAVLAVLVPIRPLQIAAIQLAFGYLALVAAFLAPVAAKRFAGRMPDYSYGIYIYAFPAQQTVLALGIGVTPIANIVTAFALLLPFAAASWHFIEKPALALKPGRRALRERARPALE